MTATPSPTDSASGLYSSRTPLVAAAGFAGIFALGIAVPHLSAPTESIHSGRIIQLGEVRSVFGKACTHYAGIIADSASSHTAEFAVSPGAQLEELKAALQKGQRVILETQTYLPPIASCGLQPSRQFVKKITPTGADHS